MASLYALPRMRSINLPLKMPRPAIVGKSISIAIVYGSRSVTFKEIPLWGDFAGS